MPPAPGCNDKYRDGLLASSVAHDIVGATFDAAPDFPFGINSAEVALYLDADTNVEGGSAASSTPTSFDPPRFTTLM